MPPTDSTSSYLNPLLQAIIEVLLITTIMFVVGSGLPPAVNEAHYLGKARHFWNPDWCPRDPFLGSADAHLPFYWAFGWLTNWTSLSTAAWIGRFAGWILLATAWQRLSWSLVPVKQLSVLSAAVWIAFVDRGHMSGEWILGGVEAKVFAYPLVLFGLTDLVKGRWRRSWIWFGCAASCHVLVGGWAAVTGLFSWCVQRRDVRPSFAALVPGLIIGALLSLPGLIPALRLSINVPPDVRAEASQIYVHERLPHHLMIRDFEPWFIVRHVALMIAFVAIGWHLRQQTGFRAVWGFVIGAIGLAAIGCLIDISSGSSEFGASLLRYYWFRPSDVFVPLGVSLAVGLWIERLKATEPRRAALLLTLCVLLVSCALVESAWRLSTNSVPAADRQGGIQTLEQWKQWQDLGAWCDDNLPPDALVLTPVRHQTFRWNANRSELVNWKDIPQDAVAIIAWQQRRQDVDQLWLMLENQQHQMAHDRLLELADKYAFDYVVLPVPVKMPGDGLIPRYQNPSYVVLQLK